MAMLVLWLVVVIMVSARHEVWRDEVRALSIALEPGWFWELPAILKNEGHPILWYLILRAGFSVMHSPAILKAASICIALGAVIVFFRYAPFPAWQKTLFLWGVFPSYYYSVVARNYGISMFLLFLFSAVYKRRTESPLLVACILLFLANTNVHSCVLAGILFIVWFWDQLAIGGTFWSTRRGVVFLCAVALVVIGILGAIITSFPDRETVVTGIFSLETSQVTQALWMNMMHPGRHFGGAFPGFTPTLRDVLIWMLIAGLFIRPMAAGALYVGTVFLGFFFTIVFPGKIYHQGILIVFLVSLYWIVLQEEQGSETRVKLRKHLRLAHIVSAYGVLSVILCSHLVLSIYEIRVDLFKDMSGSRAFGEFLAKSPEYQEAVIMGEPDYLLESLPYYAPNRIYIPRERRFGKRVMFTRAGKARLTLGELLTIGKEVRNKENRPVLIALGHFDLTRYAGCELGYSYNKVFSASSEELTKFRDETFKIAEFKTAVLDENYEIYCLR